MVARDLPGWTAPYEGEPETRLKACISDDSVGRRWVEVPTVLGENKHLVRPTLHTCTDLASVGAPALHWLYQVQKVRGVFYDDWLHSDWNIFSNSLATAGIKSVVLERALIQNLPSGPFKGPAFFQEFRSQALRYLEMAGPSDPLFLACFDRMCKASGHIPDDNGSFRHRSEMFEALRASPVFKNKGN